MKKVLHKNYQITLRFLFQDSNLPRHIKIRSGTVKLDLLIFVIIVFTTVLYPIYKSFVKNGRPKCLFRCCTITRCNRISMFIWKNKEAAGSRRNNMRPITALVQMFGLMVLTLGMAQAQDQARDQD